MTKMARTSSYLRNIARRPDSSLLQVMPPRALKRSWEVAAARDGVSEITPSIAPQRSLAVNTGPDTDVPSLQTPEQHPMEQTFTPAVKKEVEVLLEANSSPATRPASMHTHSVPAHISPIIEDSTDSTPTTRRQRPEEEIQLTPVKPGKAVHGLASVADQASLTIQINAAPQDRAPSAEQHSNVTLRPKVRQESGATTTASTSTRGKRSGDAHLESNVITKDPIQPAQITLLPQPQERPTASLSQQEKPQPRPTASLLQQEKPQTPQGTTIHIGTIEVQIVPPAAPGVPLPALRATAPRPRSTQALSRELTSFIGLRQG